MILKSTNTLWALDGAELIGSRAFSKSFLHSIMVTVKEIKKKETREEQEWAKCKVLHKATLLSELGVQPGLTHLFSIHSEQDPF